MAEQPAPAASQMETGYQAPTKPVQVSETLPTDSSPVVAMESAPQNNSQMFLDALTCPICLSLLCEPLTTTCGHTFCRTCLVSSLSRSRKHCPTCREVCQMQPLIHAETVVVAELARTLFPDLYEERKRADQQIKQEAKLDLPVFLYNSVVYPGSNISLHLFEPRYRVMMKRVVEAEKKFVWMPVLDTNQFGEGATAVVVKLNRVEFFHDGRSLIEGTAVDCCTLSAAWVEDGTHGLCYASVQETPRTALAAEHIEEAEQIAEMLHAAILALEPEGLPAALRQQAGPNPGTSNVTTFAWWFTSLASNFLPADRELEMLTCDVIMRLRFLKKLVVDHKLVEFIGKIPCALAQQDEEDEDEDNNDE